MSGRAMSVMALVGIVGVAAGHRGLSHHARKMSGTEVASINCIPCHVLPRVSGPLASLWNAEYASPLRLAVVPDGTLLVTAEEGGALFVVDPERRAVLDQIAVGGQPHSVITDARGRTAYVTDRWGNRVSVIDLATRTRVSTIPVGAQPGGMSLDASERTLFVANSGTNDISVVDLPSGRAVQRLPAGSHPYSVRGSPIDETIVVLNRLTSPVEHRAPPVTEVTLVDAATRRVVRRVRLDAAHMAEGLAVTPDGATALLTIARPKNLLPATQIARGWMITYGVALLDMTSGRVVQLLLDDVNQSYADPYDVVLSPDGRRAFVSHAGADVVSVIDVPALRALAAAIPDDSLARYANDLSASRQYVVARIPTGPNPMGLAVSADGGTLYVAERVADQIRMIDVATGRDRGVIPLGSPQRESFVRRGERLFNSAGHTAQGQFSCRSCHPEGHTDALNYDLEPDGLGRNIVNNISLRELSTTAPYKWTGKNVSLYRQCGFRFAKWLTRTAPYSQRDLQALVAYIMSLEHMPNPYATADGPLAVAAERGRTIFERAATNDGRTIDERDRCVTCHPPPLFTDGRMADVGTGADTDTQHEFDTPVLTNLAGSGPYLHDGRANSLEELWTRFNPDDRHGVANDLTKAQLNDLVVYLMTLGGARD
jgi:YVTN family beta-propeller protein